MIPSSHLFDQSTMQTLLAVDPLVQEYRALFSLFDWSVVDDWQAQRSSRGRPGHSIHAYLKAFLLRVHQKFIYASELRHFLVTHRQGIAAIAFNLHGHPEPVRDVDGVPFCDKGFRMHLVFPYAHTYGYRAQHYRCPLLFPQKTGQNCDHAQFAKGKKGCVKDVNIELGGLMRVNLDRESPLYKSIYNQRTSTERGNSQSKAKGLERPKVRNIRSIRTLNTLTYLVLNAKALQKARTINASLFTTMLGTIA